jgi:hypothetical protein
MIDDGKYVIKVEHRTQLTATFEKMQIAGTLISFETLQQHESTSTKVADISISDSKTDTDDPVVNLFVKFHFYMMIT